MATRPSGMVSESRRTARAVQWTIVFFGVYLLVLFVGGLTLVRLVTQSQEEFLPSYIDLVGRAITEPPRDYFWSLQFVTNPETGEIDDEDLAYYSASIDWENLQRSLQAAGREALVRHAHLLTPAGEILMDETGSIVPAEQRKTYLQKESEAIALAGAGEAYRLPTSRRNPQVILYQPVRYMDPGGQTTVVGILRLEANPARFVELRALRIRLFIGFWASVGVLVFLYLGAIQLVRRTLQAERIASQSDRLRALGTMTAGIAHEIRNPLGILMLQVEELRASLRTLEDSRTSENLDSITREIQQEAARLKRLTEEFVRFGGAGTAEGFTPVSIDAAHAVRSIVKLWEKGLNPSRIEVTTSIPEGLPKALFTEDRLRQILLNLLRNATDALAERGGRIDIDVREKSGWLEISVGDNGPGIDATTQRQIFDPFFTTKAEGTGLGLSLSRAFAQAAGGDLDVTSAPGKGARFTLRLRIVAL